MPRQNLRRGWKAEYRSLCVFGVRFYEKVHVVRKARLRVMDNRKAAHNKVFNATGPEGGQKVFVVLVHQAQSSIP